MLLKPNALPTHLRRVSRIALMLLLLTCSVLPACSTKPIAEPPVIARKPKPVPLPAAVLQIERKPSTDSLQKGLEWSQRSEVILRSETPR